MPLFLDRHDLPGTPFEFAEPSDIMEAHRCDLAVQGKFGVQYLTYWWRYGAKTAFCLFDAPTKEAAISVHLEAHGELATNIIEVERDSLESFLGRIVVQPEDQIREDVAFRVVLCATLDEQTVEAHGKDITQAISDRGGSHVSDSTNELLASFAVPEAALRAALSIQNSLLPAASIYEGRGLSGRIGICGGEPVITHMGLFGDTIEKARQLAFGAQAGEIVVSQDVRAMCGSANFIWAETPHGWQLQGHQEPASVELKIRASDQLSSREVEVLSRIAAGDTNDEIADRLCISRNTVATHVRHILAKTDSANRAEATFYAVRHGLI